MAVSPFKAEYDPLTPEERLAAAYEAIDKINALGQSNDLRQNALVRAKLESLMKEVDWLEAKVAASNGPAFNYVRFRHPCGAGIGG